MPTAIAALIVTLQPILCGELMSTINKARSEGGDKGQDISAAEKKEIFDAFHALENKMLKIN